jgi:hypothetical protein
MPRLKEGIKGGFSGPPEEKTFEIHNLQQAKKTELKWEAEL